MVAMALLLVAVVLAGCNPLNPEELRRQVESFRSIAAEGSLIAADVADDRTKATFVRVQADTLAGEADDGAQKLNDASAPEDLQQHVARAIDLAQRASAALGDLAVSPGNEAVGAQAEDELRRIAAEAEEQAAAINEEEP